MGDLEHVVLVTGMSGAGRSQALDLLEDLGYYCVDNLPPPLGPHLLRLLEIDGAADSGLVAPTRKVALGIDVRAGIFFDNLKSLVDQLGRTKTRHTLLFLECEDSALVRRFSAVRRRHPLDTGDGDVLAAIRLERQKLADTKTYATAVVDTSKFSPHDLKHWLVDYLEHGGAAATMVTRFLSFGFKYGVPLDADLVFDVRYLPNPHFIPELKPQNGLDEAVAAFVLKQEATQSLLNQLEALLRDLLPRYSREGKAQLTVAIGCTGGKHRSVAVVEALSQTFRDVEPLRIVHRERERWAR